MPYQDDVAKMQSAGFSGQEIQNWSDDQAVKLRQAGFSQDEVDVHQGMVPPEPGTPTIQGRLPTDDDFKNAASVILAGKDHPNFGGAVETLKDLHAQHGVAPEQAAKAANAIPSFRDIMESGEGNINWKNVGMEAAHSVGQEIGGMMQGAAINSATPIQLPPGAHNPVTGTPYDNQQMQDLSKIPAYTIGQEVRDWTDKHFPTPEQFEKQHPIVSGVTGGLAALPALMATGGLGMDMTSTASGYESNLAEQAKGGIDNVNPQKAAIAAQRTGMVWGALGVADVGVLLKPVERSAPGALPWIVAKGQQALRAGLTFAGTNEFGDWLSTQVNNASEIPTQYKPTLNRIIANFTTGAIAGPLAPTGVKPGAEKAPPTGGETSPPGAAPETPSPSQAETPPPGAGPVGQKYKADYDPKTDTFGLKNANGDFIKTGFNNREEANEAAPKIMETPPMKETAEPSRLDQATIDRYKKMVSDQAEKAGLTLTDEQLNNAARLHAENLNPVEKVKNAPPFGSPEGEGETKTEDNKTEGEAAEGEEQSPYANVPKRPFNIQEFLAQNGGLKDEAGELVSMDAHKSHINPDTGKAIPFARKLVRDDGMSLDDAARKAQEAGFFPELGADQRPTVNQLLDKIKQSLSGDHQFSEHDADAVEAHKSALESNSEIDRISSELGIDTAGKTQADFWNEVGKNLDDAKLNELTDQYEQQLSDSWRTESLEPEELERVENEWQESKSTDSVESIGSRPQQSEGEAGGPGVSKTGIGSSDYGTEIAGHPELQEPFRTGEHAGAEPSAGSGSAERVNSSAKLPRELAGAKPRYGFGDKKFTLSFDSDIDKALYTTGQKSPNKRDADYRKFLKDNGFTDAQIEAGSKDIRARIKKLAKDHDEFEDKQKLSDIKVEDGTLYEKTGDLPPEAHELLDGVTDIIKRIAPNADIKIEKDGDEYGSYDRAKDLITLSLSTPDQVATGSHEAFHAVSDLLTEAERQTLVDEANSKGLMDKYNIKERYADQPANHNEEMIGHWFGDWMSDKEANKPTENTKTIFEKIKDLLSSIADKVRSMFGNRTAEDIFKDLESGKVGNREGSGEGTKEGTLFQKKESPTLGDALRGIRDTFSPTSAGGLAKGTETAIRAAYGEAKRQQSISETALNEFARQANEMVPSEHADFYNYVEGRSKGAQLKNKQFQAMADTIRDVYSNFKNILQQMPETQLVHFVTDYFTHQWAPGQDEKIRDFMSSWWQQGSGKNLKERQIPTIADGLAAGLELAEPNPVRAVSKYVGSMTNYIASVKVLRAINKDLGGGYYADGKQPENYKPLVGRNAERIQDAKVDPASGEVVPAKTLHLYAPKEVADLFNVFYSKGFEDTKLSSAYKMARGAINANTMMELGLSLYHFSTITMQSMNQDMGRLLRNAVAGDWQGVGEAAKGIVTPGLHFYQGMKGIEKYQQPGRNSSIADGKLGSIYESLSNHGIDINQLADHFAQTNMRLGIDPLANVSTHGGFYKAYQRGELPDVMSRLKSQLTEGYGYGALKSGAEAASRVISDFSHPLFNVYIPAIKMSAFHDLMADWLRQNPEASDGEIAANRVRIADMVEDRFGEMNMENLFWNKKAKELIGLGVRAPGWDLGLIRQAGGAGVDFYHLLKSAVRGGNGFDASRLDRPLFMVGAVLLYAALNSVGTMMHTGVMPTDDKLKDLIAYATGGHHKAFGDNPERGELPGHGRELIQMAPIPGEGPLSGLAEEASNKVATLPKNLWQAANNTDWQGKKLYDPKSPNTYQRVPLLPNVLHVAKGFTPFTAEQLLNSPGESHLTLAERIFGVRSAGAKIVNPEGLKAFNERKVH